MNSKLNTIGDYLHWAVEKFDAAQLYYGHGTDNAFDEALYLILYALGISTNQEIDESILNRHLDEIERKKIVDLLLRRVRERKPAAYLTHQAFFAGLEFYVDERVLIPRSPLAELIAEQFAPWLTEPQKTQMILDIGTGSGCLAIACAYALPQAQVDAVDLSIDALEVAKINVAKHGMEERVRLIQSDLFEALGQEKYDVIISNPPYVSSAEMQELPQEYTHEPAQALVAGDDGLLFVDRLLREAKNHLQPNGILIVEVGNSVEALLAKYPQVPFIWLEFACGESEVFLLDLATLHEIF